MKGTIFACLCVFLSVCFFIRILLLYSVVLVSAAHQSESAVIHLYPLCHPRALNRVPREVQQVLISYLFYT